MNSDTYKTRRKNVNFFTKEICIRGFARELKMLLLKDPNCSTLDPEYSSVSKAFTEQLGDAIASRLKLEVLSQEDKNKLSNYTFVEGPGFSNWWGGKKYPGEASKYVIDYLFPGLVAKWFDRSNFKNRMQLHLASLDLFHLSRNCNCKIEGNAEAILKKQCNQCLEHALYEAEWMLSAIHNDWKPTNTRYLNQFDVCITGPEKRSGINVFETHFMSIATYNNPKPIKEDPREKIAYNLALEETSFIGLPIPEEVAGIYQDENIFSVVMFLFLLIGLDLETEVEYRDDLILDLMTAVNCAEIILFVKHGDFLLSSNSDFIEQKIQDIFFHSSEYFYDKPSDLNEKLLGYEKVCRQSNETGDPPFDFIVLPMTHISCHTGFKLTEVFTNILSLVINSENIDSFIAENEELTHVSSYTESKIDEYLNKPYSNIFKSFENARRRYLSLFDVVGYTETELVKNLRSSICRPMNTNYIPGKAPQKESPYSEEMIIKFK